MWGRRSFCVVCRFTLLLCAAPALSGDLTLWYRQPANLWVEALPVGNGRLGGMVFGGIAHERIQFNEQTVWTGGPHDYAQPGAYQSLGKIRDLLWAGNQKEAEDLAMKKFLSVPLHQKAYQAFGDLLLDFPGVDPAGVTGYRRDLDLDTATSTVQYEWHGVTYRREVFASYPANVLVVRLTASQPASVQFAAALKSAHEGSAISAAGEEVTMAGGVKEGAIRFEARLLVNTDGGTRAARDGRIVVSGANSATLILAGATNFRNYRDVSADPKARNDQTLEAARTKSFDALRGEHLADFQKLFGRVSLSLGSADAATLPTDERIARFATGHDPALVALVFQVQPAGRPAGQPSGPVERVQQSALG